MEITLLYASLLSILAVFLAYKTGTLRLKTNTLLGAGDSSEMLQSIRAFGNLSEYAPLAIIMLGLLELPRCCIMEAAFAWLNIFFMSYLACLWDGYFQGEHSL